MPTTSHGTPLNVQYKRHINHSAFTPPPPPTPGCLPGACITGVTRDYSSLSISWTPSFPNYVRIAPHENPGILKVALRKHNILTLPCSSLCRWSVAGGGGRPGETSPLPKLQTYPADQPPCMPAPPPPSPRTAQRPCGCKRHMT